MKSPRLFKQLLVMHRPSGTTADAITRLARIAVRWRETLDALLDDIGSDAFALEYDQVDDLALAMTELAEDLHTDTGLWRALESANRALFDTPLPLLMPPGAEAPARFDARRFQFYLDGVWRHFQPERIVSMRHEGFRRIAAAAAAFFLEAFAAEKSASSVAAFFDGDSRRGWDVKRKLVWLGTHSFLLRFAYDDYCEEQDPEACRDDPIPLTDDFLCQQCSTWSGLGALELLAERLGLTPEERADLLGWHARHAAFYRVEAVAACGSLIETMAVTNLLNDRRYDVRVEMPRAQFPFRTGQMVFGSLVSWRGEWYWSGAQQTWPQVPADFARIRRDLIERQHRIVYRYRPDLRAKAAEFSAEQHVSFVRYHGSELAVFPAGLDMAAAEQKRMREANEARAAVDENARKALAGQRGRGTAPGMSLPREVLDCRSGVAVFSDPLEGFDVMLHFDALRAGLRSTPDALDDEQARALRDFVESPDIGPAFVRRVAGLHGWSGLAALYCLPPDDPLALDYLLRRYKGAYYRPRLPNLALLGVEA